MYIITLQEISEMNGFLKKPDPYDSTEKVVFGIGYYVKVFPLFLYAYTNSRSINFKEWMRDVMKGLKKERQYPNWSIFI